MTRSSRAALVQAKRPSYLAELAEGTARFFAPRTATCPWCGGDGLRERLNTVDLLQHKPGRFILDECVECGHVFQNPQLNPIGLDFYYRDLYDGLGAAQTDAIFRMQGKAYRSRVSLVANRCATLDRWLDVGTGHGHFPRAAREVLPKTTFDGLDQASAVDKAVADGWIDTGHRGRFVDLPDRTAQRYDVISMLHYLEHTSDPRAELATANKMLREGGHLLIEVPDPKCRFANWLGRWWLPWTQPQHLHMMPLDNLCAAVERAGFTVVARQQAEAHQALDLSTAVWLGLDAAAPRADLPWLPKSPRWPSRVLRVATIAAGVPFMVVAALLDKAIKPVARPLGLTDAYRILAVRTG